MTTSTVVWWQVLEDTRMRGREVTNWLLAKVEEEARRERASYSLPRSAPEESRSNPHQPVGPDDTPMSLALLNL